MSGTPGSGPESRPTSAAQRRGIALAAGGAIVVIGLLVFMRASPGPSASNRGTGRPSSPATIGAATAVGASTAPAASAPGSADAPNGPSLSEPPVSSVPAEPTSSSEPGASTQPGGSSTQQTTTSRPIATGPFAGGLLIADRGNGRLLIVNNAGHVVWHFPVAGSVPKGQGFSADDAFLSPDGKSISANEEQRQIVVRIDIASRRIVWQYGHYDQLGSKAGYLNTPDDAYPLANGDIVIADIFNCRVIEVSPAKKIVRQWGHTGTCRDRPPFDYNQPNGDTPLPDGGLLITEITGSRVVRLDAAGKVMFDIHVPVVYPSDAQLDPNGNVVVADYTNPGAVVDVTPAGRLLWRYGPKTGPGRLDHPSLAVPRADGTVVLNDDFNDRVILINPRTGKILWQYGVSGVPGRGANHLSIPDGMNEVPAGTVPGL